MNWSSFGDLNSALCFVPGRKKWREFSAEEVLNRTFLETAPGWQVGEILEPLLEVRAVRKAKQKSDGGFLLFVTIVGRLHAGRHHLLKGWAGRTEDEDKVRLPSRIGLSRLEDIRTETFFVFAQSYLLEMNTSTWKLGDGTKFKSKTQEKPAPWRGFLSIVKNCVQT